MDFSYSSYLRLRIFGSIVILFLIKYATYFRGYGSGLVVRVVSTMEEVAAATCLPSSRSARKYREYSKPLKWIAERETLHRRVHHTKLSSA